MPSTTIEISREQRQSLHRLVTQHISGIGDVNLMIEQRDFATAERFGLEFGEDIRMLDDLGWDPEDARDSYALTQPCHELIEALKRLRLDAEEGLDPPEDERRKREELNIAGHESAHVRDYGTQAATDEEIFARAQTGQCVVVSAASHRKPRLGRAFPLPTTM
jgi:hypothetical protein